jgi:4-alpha-glucanotransferase
MNTPGKLGGNWSWRFDFAALTPELSAKLQQLALTYGRAANAEKKAKPEWM